MTEGRNRGGRPLLLRLGVGLGDKLRDFIGLGREKERLTTKELYGKLSAQLKESYGVGNSPRTVENFLAKACAGRYLRADYVECLEVVFGLPVPLEIRDIVRGLARPAIRPSGDRSLLDSVSPSDFRGRLVTLKQPKVAKLQVMRSSEVLEGIEGCGIPVRIEAAEYFRRFFEFIEKGATRKRVQVFARLINLVARGNLGRFGPREFFPTCRRLVNEGLMEIEYVIFLYGRNELNLPEVKSILSEYRSFASSVYLHFATESKLSDNEISQTIALWSEDMVFTHGWDHRGGLDNLTQWVLPEECERLRGWYAKIRAHSELQMKGEGSSASECAARA
jgi:hypothetical protein